MKRHSVPYRRSLAVLVAAMALAAVAPAAEDKSYTVHNLVADTPRMSRALLKFERRGGGHREFYAASPFSSMRVSVSAAHSAFISR